MHQDERGRGPGNRPVVEDGAEGGASEGSAGEADAAALVAGARFERRLFRRLAARRPLEAAHDEALLRERLALQRQHRLDPFLFRDWQERWIDQRPWRWLDAAAEVASTIIIIYIALAILSSLIAGARGERPEDGEVPDMAGLLDLPLDWATLRTFRRPVKDGNFDEALQRLWEEIERQEDERGTDSPDPMANSAVASPTGGERAGIVDRIRRSEIPLDLLDSATGGDHDHHGHHGRATRSTDSISLPAPQPSIGEEDPIPAVNRRGRRLRGWDCSEPANLISVSLRNDVDRLQCDEESLQREQEKKRYLLLQKATRTEHHVIHCHAKYYRVMYVCGMHSHSEVISWEWKFDQKWVMNRTTCDQAWYNGTVIIPRFNSDHVSDTYFVKKDRINYIRARRTGRESHKGTQFACEGETIQGRYLEHPDWKGKTLSGHAAVATDYINLGLFRRKAYLPTDAPDDQHSQLSTLWVPSINVRLHCNFGEGYCQTESFGSFLWIPFPPLHDNICPIYKLKEVAGVVVKAKDTSMDDGDLTDAARRMMSEGQEQQDDVFIATNGTMLRVKKIGDPISMCGSTIYPTEYPQIYLSEAFNHSAFQRPLDPLEVNPFTAFQMADQFLYEQVQDDLSRSLLSLQVHQCKQQRERRMRDTTRLLARQKAVVDGETAHIGDGIFATAVGDAAYLYHCRPLDVTAVVRGGGKCYSALPVEPDNPADKERFQRWAAKQGEVVLPEGADPSLYTPEVQMYILPRTHKITTSATEVECVAQMPSLWENLDGGWFKHSGDNVHSTIPPKDPQTEVDVKYYRYDRRNLPEPGESGPYDWKVVLSFIKLTSLPDIGMTLPMSLSRQAKYILGAEDRTMHQDAFGRVDVARYMTSMTAPVSFMQFQQLSWLWNGILDYYVFISAYLLISTSYKLIIYGLAVCRRFALAYKSSCCYRICYSFFPSLTTLLCLGLYDPMGPSGPFKDLVVLIDSLMQKRGYRPITRELRSGDRFGEDDTDDESPDRRGRGRPYCVRVRRDDTPPPPPQPAGGLQTGPGMEAELVEPKLYPQFQATSAADTANLDGAVPMRLVHLAKPQPQTPTVQRANAFRIQPSFQVPAAAPVVAAQEAAVEAEPLMPPPPPPPVPSPSLTSSLATIEAICKENRSTQ